ncbi:hypothetical protein M501DRAFT_135375 [Patellaria atrata CBS 101060]|uniref:Glucosidase 2 subunit beta n=1 Tax=Patellaria atrata CBS 101060 TaxID=1346257 RepID=A0A9P4S7Z6_9PEZI|nr:hypothetical protein M501DRAFT_135375 [Patellaria atrata CBS 101060]
MKESFLGQLALLGSIVNPSLAASEPSRPRGVSPEFSKFYKSTDGFACISNPSIEVALSQVNDDYCDCPDGSDEPGTSACSHLSPLSPRSPIIITDDDDNITVSLPGFYCKNKGHQPSYLPFTNVNDGICDYDLCCDGSDEWEGVGGVKCEDKCKEIGKEWRKHDEQRQKSMSTANRKRKELVLEAARRRMEVEDRIRSLGEEITALEFKATTLEKQLVEVERKEKFKVVTGGGQGGKLGILASLAKNRITELSSSLSRVRNERDSTRERLNELEGILTRFKEEYNPNFNDEGVKRAVRAWENYAARDKGSDDNAALDRDLDEILKPDAENGLNWEEFEEADQSDVDVLYQFEAYLPGPVREWVDQKLRDLRTTLIENGILAGPKDDAQESKAVIEARQAVTDARNHVENYKRDRQNHKDDLEKDYGPDDVFRALKGQCIDKDAGEYNYEFCFLDKTTQKPKKGGSNTGMGNFVRIEKVMVDEDVPPDGKGLGSGERIALKYENGQHCWNGPNRSTTVILACAEKDELWKIVEEEKCVYRMEVGTPAACGYDSSGKTSPPPRDEL